MKILLQNKKSSDFSYVNNYKDEKQFEIIKNQ